ncbi:MAG: BamA/TamA family outer membrane protein [Candidatus Schekmanbacteria bacterium]|nr:BamA/TamA family outer membrane protein [Candidatus Schekmanbacteria bacterium]
MKSSTSKKPSRLPRLVAFAIGFGWFGCLAVPAPSAASVASFFGRSAGHVANVAFAGADEALADVLPLVVMVQKRDLFDEAAVALDVARIQSLGVYADVQADVTEEATGVTVRYRVSGRTNAALPRLDAIRIEGNIKTKERVVLRRLRLAVGDSVEWQRLVAAMRRLQELRFFEKVRFCFGPPPAAADDSGVTLVVTIVEGLTQIGFGWLTYSSDNPDLGGLGPIAGYVNMNLFGTGAQFGFGGMWAETKVVVVGGRLLHPLDTAATLTFGAGYLDQEQELFDRDARETGDSYRALGTTAIAFWDQSLDRDEHWHLFGGMILARTRFRAAQGEPPAAGGRSALAIASVYLDRRDDRTEPTRGYVAELRLDQGYQDADAPERSRGFLRFNPELRGYWRLGPRHCFAAQGKAGVANRDIPFLAKYTLGGYSSMRGYPSEGMRGDTYIWGTVEYRFPIYEIRDDQAITGVVFSEAGDAWDRGSDDAPWQFRLSGGVGLRAIAGPFVLRADYGVARDSSGFYIHFGHYF